QQGIVQGGHQEPGFPTQPDRDHCWNYGNLDQQRSSGAHRDRGGPKLRLWFDQVGRHLALHLHPARHLPVLLSTTSLHEGRGDREGGPMSRAHGRLAVASLTLAAILVACFSEHSPAGPDNATLCTNPGGSVVNGSTLVIIREFAFETQNVTVQAGASVTWVNCETSGTAHTSTSD